MKTTFDLPDALVIAAKKRAAELRKPLRELVEAGLRTELARKPEKDSGKRKRLKLTMSRGRLPKDLDLESRAKMWEWIGKQR